MVAVGPIDVTVVGLGYVGLSLASALSAVGYRVTGLDTAQRVVEKLNRGISHIGDVTDKEVVSAIAAGFRATTSASCVASSDAVVVCVPTPLADDRTPDLSSLIAACEQIARHLRAGTLVVVESTTYPGTTEEVIRPLLDQSGLTVGESYHLVFSPERVDPGSPDYGIRNTPKVVGGVTDVCAERARALYASFVEHVVLARGTREAEMAKLLENTYRHVNIALVNEMAKFCHELDIDLWDVIRLAATKPFGFQAFRPGPGVGGHCIPIDPNYLSHTVQTRLGYPFRLVELAQEINESMPGYVYQRIQELLNDQSRAVRRTRVLLLGVTYKPDVADLRESPAGPLARRLLMAGARLSYHDPHIDRWQPEGAPAPVRRLTDLGRSATDADLVVLLQGHREYCLLDEWFDVTVLDTRGVLRESHVHPL